MLRHCLAAFSLSFLSSLSVAGPAQAQWPEDGEFEAAVAAAAPLARAAGLSLRTAGLWSLLVRERTVLASRRTGGACEIGFNRYTPGRDLGWLFPDLPPALRLVWLRGLVGHELAHCVDPTGAGGGKLGLQQAHQREVWADLAFALHVQADAGAQGDALIDRLAALRQAQQRVDPHHDSSQALRCFLQQHSAERLGTAAADAGPGADWVQRLQLWMARCGAGE